MHIPSFAINSTGKFAIETTCEAFFISVAHVLVPWTVVFESCRVLTERMAELSSTSSCETLEVSTLYIRIATVSVEEL